jgi:hypothetical protein
MTSRGAWKAEGVRRCIRGLTVTLRGRTPREAALTSNEALQAAPKRPGRRRGRTIFPRARGANQATPHGPLQRLLGAGWRSRHQAIATHDGNQRTFIRCPASIEDISNIAEILRSNVRSQEDQSTRVLIMRVAESVH